MRLREKGGHSSVGRSLIFSGIRKMPWKPDDTHRHTKKADTVELSEMWSEVANKVLAETGDEGRAVRTANAVVARSWAKSFWKRPR
jgi:hypothetical protein